MVLLIHLRMDLIDTIQADLHILRRINEVHQLFNRPVQLPNNILYRQHHTQGHLSLQHGGSCQNRYQDILHLGNTYSTGLLCLFQLQATHLQMK